MRDSRRRGLDAPPEDPSGIPTEDLAPPDDQVTVRLLSGPDEYRACEELQRDTWGRDFEGCVPALLLHLHQKTGGLVGGAFEEGRLLGFVLGFPAREDGLPYHWSHMLAVREERRGEGLGRRLKLFQRERLLERGLSVACWSFDPLVARNAHLNLNALGAEVIAYVPDMYGSTGSPLHGEAGTDRLVAFWELDGQRAREAISGDRRVDFTPFARSPEVGRPDEDAAADPGEAGRASDPAAGVDGSQPPSFPDAGRVRIEIPPRLEDLREEKPDRLASWRERVGAAFDHYLDRGYRVVALWRPPGTDRSAYCLESPGEVRRGGR